MPKGAWLGRMMRSITLKELRRRDELQARERLLRLGLPVAPIEWRPGVTQQSLSTRKCDRRRTGFLAHESRKVNQQRAAVTRRKRQKKARR